MKSRLVMLVCLLMCSSSVIASPKFSFLEEIYYGFSALKVRDKTIGVFENGISLGLGIKYKSFTFSNLSRIAYNTIMDNSSKVVGYTGNLNLTSSYLLARIWEPVVFSENEYNSLIKLNWSGYTGTGLRIYANRDKKTNVYLCGGLAVSYMSLDYSTVTNIGNEHGASFVYYIESNLRHMFQNKISIWIGMKLLPVYDFSEIQFIGDIGMAINVIDTILNYNGIERDFMVNYEIGLYVDTSHRLSDDLRITEYLVKSSFTFYM